MNISKFDGNTHLDEWINDIKKYFDIKQPNKYGDYYLRTAISLVDSNIISLPAKISSYEELSNALKEDISFTIFKCTNKRLLQSMKYIPEREGGNTSKSILNFRKLCNYSEINDIEEQKNYFYNALPNNDNSHHYYFLEFIKRKEKINSMNDLVKEFAEIITDEFNLIRSESIVALKHVATGKYLSSIENLCYTTGSKRQLACSPKPDTNAFWKIKFDKELAIYDKISINLRHIKSGNVLGLYYYYDEYNYIYTYYKSPITELTEVCCGGNEISWKFKNSKLEDHQEYLKSNDIINLSIHRHDNSQNFLRSHNVQFTIGNDTFQEIVCHNERLGGNDEWCIELIKQG
ncbi:hypothetical protein C1646_765886 [Rhizophagus diaphanus]|nr:hypothetical protein C1646_765886 [Rhizophagus diaphanus] [Rhizophagus sp. MUCL 43196]